MNWDTPLSTHIMFGLIRPFRDTEDWDTYVHMEFIVPLCRLYRKKGWKKKGKKWAVKKRPFRKKWARPKKLKKMGAWWAPTKKSENRPSSPTKSQKMVKKNAKKGQNRPSKKKGRTKKKKMGGKMGAKKSAHFFLRAFSKKKEGISPFFGNQIFVPLLPI